VQRVEEMARPLVGQMIPFLLVRSGAEHKMLNPIGTKTVLRACVLPGEKR